MSKQKIKGETLLEKRLDAVEKFAQAVYDGEIDLEGALLAMSYAAQTNFS